MSKSRISVQAAIERSTTNAKASLSLRIDAPSRELIDEAAALLGKSRNEFMIDSARQQAIDVLLDQRLFTLSHQHYEAFAQALDSPAPAGPKLRALIRRVPAWKS